MKIVPDVDSNLRVVLIGGTSHVGKSTLSESLAARLGWERVSTDTLARHPGRPWKPAPEKVPDHVAEHYLSLSVNELLEDVLHHYRVIVWPKAEEIVTSHLSHTSGAGLVLEGSALWPEFVTDLNFDRVAALWLTASDDVLRQRIHAGSMYGSKSPRERLMVGKFLQRTIAYNSLMIEVVSRHGFALVDGSQSSVVVWSLLWSLHSQFAGSTGEVDTSGWTMPSVLLELRGLRRGPGAVNLRASSTSRDVAGWPVDQSSRHRTPQASKRESAPLAASDTSQQYRCQQVRWHVKL